MITILAWIFGDLLLNKFSMLEEVADGDLTYFEYSLAVELGLVALIGIFINAKSGPIRSHFDVSDEAWIAILKSDQEKKDLIVFFIAIIPVAAALISLFTRLGLYVLL